MISLRPSSPLYCSYSQTSHRSSSSRFPFNTTNCSRIQQGKLILFSTLSSSSRNSTVETDRLYTTPVSDFVKKNDRFPTKGKEEETQIPINQNGRLPIRLELENAHFIEETKIGTTKNGDRAIDFFEKNYVTIEENVEISGSVKRRGNIQVNDFVERIRRLIVAKKIEILKIFDKDDGFLTLRNFNNLLVSLVKEDEPELAVKLFRELPSYGLVPNSRTYSVMIGCYCNNNEVDEAKRVLDRMVENGFTPDVVTYTILINSFCRRGRPQKAFEVFEVMDRTGCEPTVRTYNCLINGLCYVGRIEEAREMLKNIKKSSLKPDIYTYTVVMDGFCKVGRSDEGMELLEEALAVGLKPTAVTFNTLFNGYCKEGRPLEGINLFKQMKEGDCQPDYVSYSTLLHGLLKWDEIPAALQVYKEMLWIGFEVNERMMNSLLRGICKRSWTNAELLKDVEEVFERIKKVESGPYPYAYCLVIQALSIQGETDKAVANLHEMVTIGFHPRMITVNAVIRALCSKGSVDEALLVLVLITNGSTIPSRISYNLLIDEFNQQGRLLDACTVYGAALKRGVHPHQNPRRLLDE